MKKIILIGVIIALSIGITFYQIQIIRKETLQTFTEVIMLSRSMEMGDVIQERDLMIGRISTTWLSSDYCLTKESVVGKTLKTDYGKYGILSNKVVTDTLLENQLMEDANAITTMKFLPEEVLCWNLSQGDVVRVYFIDPNFALKDVGSVVVKAIYDNDLKDDGMPIYLLIESQKEIIKEIIRLREAGRFEIVLQGEAAAGDFMYPQ